VNIEPAEITWDASGAPYNTRYGDIYSSHDAATEVLRAFIEPAAITERLNQSSHFTIAELGFGSGLNFVIAADLALRSDCHLHFLSVERHPLRADDLLRLRWRCPGSSLALMDELIRQWPPFLEGWHRREFADGRIVLSLWFGDVADFLDRLLADHRYGVDAWFLDGFAPDRNPAMWSDATFATIGETSRSQATATTFTSVGRVRRGLEGVGFSMRRVDQRPVKRESLAGEFTRPGRASPRLSRVQVLGAGIAGCSLAAHLARRGIEVRLLEPLGAVGSGASQMCAAQHSRLLADNSAVAAWRVLSHLYSLDFTRGREGVEARGVIQLPGRNASLERLERTFTRYETSGNWLQWLTPGRIAELAGPTWRPDSGGLWFPSAPVVDLPRLCADLSTTPGIQLEFSDRIDPDVPVVFCNAAGMTSLANTHRIPLHILWGQADHVVMPLPPRIALLGDGYVLPRRETSVVGSTYEYQPWDPEKATTTNLARLSARDYRWIGRQRSTRVTTADRMPLIGKLADDWVSTAHGSMGATSAHLGAAVVQSLMMGWAPPVTPDVLEVIEPERFDRRAEKKLRNQSPAR
jgi:tRNA 5-methylaminomethyl-2-thiouridine biosynthesis bifunctional protein